jgi:hypothetical protein
LINVIISDVNFLWQESSGVKELAAIAGSGETVSIYGGVDSSEAAAAEGRMAERQC